MTTTKLVLMRAIKTIRTMRKRSMKKRLMRKEMIRRARRMTIRIVIAVKRMMMRPRRHLSGQK